MTGVYQIVCLENNKKYIGMSKDIHKRWQTHLRELKNRKHHSLALQEDYNKYGKDAFKFNIIKECHYLEAKTLESDLINLEQPAYNLVGTNKANFSDCQKDMFEIKTSIYIKTHYSEAFENGDKCLLANIFDFSEYINLSPTDVLKFLGMDNQKQLDSCKLKFKSGISIGVVLKNDGIYISISKTGVNNKFELIGGAA